MKIIAGFFVNRLRKLGKYVEGEPRRIKKNEILC